MISVTLVGRVVAKPEITQAGESRIAKFSVAVDRAGDRDSEGKVGAGFFRVEAWNEQADFADKYFDKGSTITLVGNLKHHKWESEGQKRDSVFINAVQFGFAPSGKKPEGEGTLVGAGKADDGFNPFE